LATEARPDALHVLGQVAISDHRLDAAVRALEEARTLHRLERRRAELARDALALAGAHARREQLDEALRAVEECISESQAARDRAVEGLCHLAAARTLNLIGQFEEARRELDRAEPLLSTDGEQAQLWFERGNIAQEVSRGQDRPTHEAQAVADLERALGFATRARYTDLVLRIELNLAFSLAELGRTEEAERHLARATEIDLGRDYESERGQLAARIAYRRGSLTLASSLNARAYDKIEDLDDRFEVAVMQARISLALNELAAAELWARRGVDDVEQIRSRQAAVELRPWVLASRRAPYEVLFTVLVRAGRLEAAAAVLDRWQGRTLLEAMSRPAASPDLAAMASKVQSLGRWLPVASTAPLLAGGDRGVAEALRSIDLLALAVAEGEVWRVVARR